MLKSKKQIMFRFWCGFWKEKQHVLWSFSCQGSQTTLYSQYTVQWWCMFLLFWLTLWLWYLGIQYRYTYSYDTSVVSSINSCRIHVCLVSFFCLSLRQNGYGFNQISYSSKTVDYCATSGRLTPLKFSLTQFLTSPTSTTWFIFLQVLPNGVHTTIDCGLELCKLKHKIWKIYIIL